jgi:hypothetical protein
MKYLNKKDKLFITTLCSSSGLSGDMLIERNENIAVTTDDCDISGYGGLWDFAHSMAECVMNDKYTQEFDMLHTTLYQLLRASLTTKGLKGE